MFGSYIFPKDKKGLLKTKHVSGSPTLLDKLLDHYWSLVVLFVPKWVAPNLITIFGSSLSWLSVILIIWNSPDFYMPVPRNICLFFVFCCWVQQTCDAIDGKQARRCSASSPLGSILDHGCDAISITAIAFATLNLTNCSQNIYTFMCGVLSVQMWWEHYFKVFHCNPGTCLGVTEGQILVMIVGFLSAFIDPSLWSYNIISLLSAPLRLKLYNNTGIYYLRLNEMFLIFMAVSNLVACLNMFAKGLLQIKGFTKRCRAMLQLGFYFVFAVFEILFYDFAVCRYHSYILKIMGIITIICAHAILTINMLVASATARSFDIVQVPLLPMIVWPIFKLIVKHFFRTNSLMVALSIDYNSYFITAIFLWTLFYLINYSVTCIRDICAILDIPCFRIAKKPHKE